MLYVLTFIRQLRYLFKAETRRSYGFDPFGLGSVPSNLQRFQEAELVHCRWAMLGAAGALAPELLGFGDWYNAPQWVRHLTGPAQLQYHGQNCLSERTAEPRRLAHCAAVGASSARACPGSLRFLQARVFHSGPRSPDVREP